MTAVAVLKLRRPGFAEQQVEGCAAYLDEQRATEADFASGGASKKVGGIAFAQTVTICGALRLLPDHP